MLDLSQVGRTNLYHADEERQLIDEAICHTREALQRVREEKRAITLREDALQSDLDRYLSARAPIKRLPDNVLCNIFEFHCLEDTPLVFIPFSSWSFPAQITLSHVCSTWRQLMLHIPAFWSCIGLESNLALETEQETDRADILHAWLSRAKSLPCTVKIIFRNNSWSGPVSQGLDWHRNIIKDVISLYNINKIDLMFPEYDLQEFLRLPAERLCCIEDLCIRHVDPRESITGETMAPFELHKLSSLTSFSLLSDSLSGTPRLGGVVYEDSSKFAKISWHQLRHIKIHLMFPMLFCLKILQLSSIVLETCSLYVCEDSLGPSFLKEPIHCKQLREFKVNIHSSPNTDSVHGTDEIIDPFLSSLLCPNLKSLTIGSVEQSTAGFALPQSVNVQTLLRMQSVSGMHLEELIIYNTTRNLEVLPLLASCPSLRRLVLPSTINFTQDEIHELGASSIVPLLEDLTIKKPVPPPVLETLFQIIKVRSSVGKRDDSTPKYKCTPFKSVTFYCDGPTQKEYTDIIEEINKSGVRFNVNWEGYDLDDDLIMCDSWYGGDVYHDDSEDYDEDSDLYEW